MNPERIAALFRQRDRQAARLARIDRMLAQASTAYSDANGFRTRLRPEALRREVGA